MQEGDYTFQLTVTDSAGQQNTAQVTVIVQPGEVAPPTPPPRHRTPGLRSLLRLRSPENNKPPVADAGPEKELTLPVDRTTLDGSKSTDDQKIAAYQWRQIRSVGRRGGGASAAEDPLTPHPSAPQGSGGRQDRERGRGRRHGDGAGGGRVRVHLDGDG